MKRFILGALVGALAGAGATYAYFETIRAKEGSDVIVALAGEHVAASRDEATKSGAGQRKKRRGKKRSRREDGDKGPEVVELSAADRKMIWRGPSVALPDKSADFDQSEGDEGGGGGRSMTGGEINAGISGVKAELARCIVEARGNADLSARMTLKFLVDGGGRVGAVRARAPAYMQKRGLLACARRAVRGASFASSGAHTVVTLPFDVN